MNDNVGCLRVRGDAIVDGRGDIVHLRGVNLGGWMNMENFIIGYPGHEAGLRAEMARVLGEPKSRFFFERFLDYFMAEEDIAYIGKLGCTIVRVPLNYRHFESDDCPFEYKAEGWARLDRLMDWTRSFGIYVIIDLHSAPGWQNRGWHCDNGCRETHFWRQKSFEDRAVALWEEIARRYRGDPIVAGYNIVNEPDADDVSCLNRFYRRVTAAIRAIDPNHILFLEGNHYSQQLGQLESPYDANTVYSSHHYVTPALDEGEYPGDFQGVKYDRARLAQEYRDRTAFSCRNRVPNWVGEFGCVFDGDDLEDSRLRVMSDLIDVIEQSGHHWTFWTFKDIGKMGIVRVAPASKWMQRTRPVREIQTALRTNHWIERRPREIDDLMQQIVAHVQATAGALSPDPTYLTERLSTAICEGVIQQALLPAFAEQFRGMSEDDIDQTMQSFAFRNCTPHAGLADLIARKARC